MGWLIGGVVIKVIMGVSSGIWFVVCGGVLVQCGLLLCFVVVGCCCCELLLLLLWVCLVEYGLLANDTFGLARGSKPLIQTRRMELVSTGGTCQQREREGFGMEDRVADGTGLHPIKLFFEVLFP